MSFDALVSALMFLLVVGAFLLVADHIVDLLGGYDRPGDDL